VKHSIALPLPPTLNEQIALARGSQQASSRAKKDWTVRLAKLVNDCPKFDGKVWLDFQWFTPTKSQDPDNIAAAAKYVMDGLSDRHIIQNDNLTIIQSPVIHHYAKGEKGLILTISSEPIWTLTNADSN
jgi:Holliday junction resolvase RusA-like endonuclease